MVIEFQLQVGCGLQVKITLLCQVTAVDVYYCDWLSSSEHGWNDPPQLSYQSLSGSKKPTTSLTKRVAHSTQLPTEEKNSNPSSLGPPPPHVIPLEPPPQSKQTTELVGNDQVKTFEEAVELSASGAAHTPDEVITHLETMLDNLQTLSVCDHA